MIFVLPPIFNFDNMELRKEEGLITSIAIFWSLFLECPNLERVSYAITLAPNTDWHTFSASFSGSFSITTDKNPDLDSQTRFTVSPEQ